MVAAHMKKIYIAASIMLMLARTASSQDQPARVHVMGRAEENAILLRIAPGSPALWELGNKHGYTIERFTIMRGNQYLAGSERQILTPQPLKPLPMAQWEALSLNNPFAEIAAEAIYGETFELSTDFGQDMMQLYNKAKELESRFSFALFSADVSLEVSQASGLYFKDTGARKDEQYLYRVYSAVPQNLIRSDTGFVYLGLNGYAPLPEIQDMKAKFSDKTVMLSWSTQYAKGFYSAYWIERSEDGKKFERISELPYVNTYPDDKPDPGVSYKLDSLKENYKTYHYRVIGISPFGITGPPSQPVKGEGAEVLSAAPALRKVTLVQTQTDLLWEFAKEKESAITGFEVERSSSHDKNFKSISPLLPPAARTFRDIKPLGTNYYRIRALSKNGATSFSFPMLYQLEDSIPPVQPTGLTGRIDTTGVVTLHWNSNTEADVNGYRVFRSNFQNSEFSQVTRDPVDSARFKERIPLQNLSRAVYYKIQAIDTRFNPSAYSAVIKLLKPDVVPPVLPVFKSWNATQDKVSLSWAPSSSRDVAYHNLRVKPAGTTGWILIKNFSVTDKPMYEYKNLKSGLYEFVVEAIDSSGNMAQSKPLKATLTGTIEKPMQNIKATADRTDKKIILDWRSAVPEAKKILIYRAEAEKPVTLYKSIAGTSTRFTDDQLSLNTTYHYYLKIVFENGSESEFSEKTTVTF